MSLRPLLDLALDDERFLALADAAREGGGGARVHVRRDPAVPAGRAGRGRGGARRAAGAGRRRRRHRRARPGARARRLPGAATRPLLPLAGHRLRVAPDAAAAPRRPADRRAGCASADPRAGGGRGQRGRARRGRAGRLAAPGGLRPRRAATRWTSTSVGEPPGRGRLRARRPGRGAGPVRDRGGILDVFAATEDRAARVELFGDEIESIRWFSTFTQRSLGERSEVELSPAAELGLEHRELAELALEERRGGAARDLGASSCRSSASAPRWS